MREFNRVQKQYCWAEIEAMMKGIIGETKTEEMFSEAMRLCIQYEEQYRDLKGFEKRHAEAAYHIAALYIPLRNAVGSEKAIRILDDAWKPAAMRSNARYNKLPSGVFIMLCRIISASAFGNKAGFVRQDRSRNRSEVRFDITSCPYVRIMTELGCAEACPIVCQQDEYTYGCLHGVKFERTKTLGRGDEKCDFCYRMKRKDER